MALSYNERQLEISPVGLESLNAFHSSSELHDFIDKMDSIRLTHGADLVEWNLTSHRKFTVRSCHGFLNDGGLRSKFYKDIWKATAPMKVRIFA